MSQHGDSVYVDSLVIKRKIEAVSRAPAYAKAAVQDMDAARSSNRVLVKYRGGSLKVRDFARWLNALDPQILSALPQANDEQINQFLKSLAQQQLMLQMADSAKVMLTAEDWQRVRDEHDSTMVQITTLLNLSAAVLHDSGGPSPEKRVNFAMGRVNDYFDRVFHGRARFYPLPAFLADTLLADARWHVDAAGVRRAVERGQEIRADSGQASNAPRMTPAPGPAPIDTRSGRRQDETSPWSSDGVCGHDRCRAATRSHTGPGSDTRSHRGDRGDATDSGVANRRRNGPTAGPGTNAADRFRGPGHDAAADP